MSTEDMDRSLVEFAPRRVSAQAADGARNADKLAGLIMRRPIDGCPRSGFAITFCGTNPWNAMLTIRPQAGPHVDRELWRSQEQDIGVQLRNDFDVANASSGST